MAKGIDFGKIDTTSARGSARDMKVGVYFNMRSAYELAKELYFKSLKKVKIDSRRSFLSDSVGNEVQKTIVLCSTPRVGSTLLGYLMWDTGYMGFPDECFNFGGQLKSYCARFGFLPDNLTKSHKARKEYLDTLKRHRTTPNGVFSIKMHYYQKKVFLGQASLQSYFSNIFFIHLIRKDEVAQAVSWAQARKGRWSAGRHNHPEGDVSAELVKHYIEDIRGQNREWEEFFEKEGVEPLQLSYEFFSDNHTEALKQIADWCGIRLPKGFKAPKPAMTRQWNPRKAAWVNKLKQVNIVNE